MPSSRNNRANIQIPRFEYGTATRFLKDTNGATAVEFALVSIPFLGLLFAIFETALVFFTAQTVDAATAEAARQIMTGQAQGDSSVTTAAQFKTKYLCPTTGRILPSYVNCNTIVVDVRPATTWTSADQTKNFFTETNHKYCTGGSSQIVVLRVGYPMPVYLSVLAMNNSGDAYVSTAGQTNISGSMKHLIVATSVFQNEPFPGVTALSGC